MQQAWATRGPLATALLPVAAAFAAVSGMRRWLYRVGWLRREALPVPVIVVGNLIVGGAGKTPTVMAIVSLLRRAGYTPGIVSRGWGRGGNDVVDVTPAATAAAAGDEPLLVHLRCRVPVVVGRDRVAAGRELLRRHPATDVIVSDDGLQHLRLARAADVLLFDERGAGNGWLLPAGPLREPIPARTPPRTLVLYNAPEPTTALPGSLARRALAGLVLLPRWWDGEAASTHALALLRGHTVVAAAGIAQPQRFFDTLRAAGLTLAPLPLPDHHDFATLPWPADTPDVIVTEKDAVKLAPQRIGATRVWVAPLDFDFDAAFGAALLRLLPPPHTRNSDGHATA